MPTIISGKNFKLSPAVKDYVTSKLKKLERYSDHILWTKAELDHSTHHRTGLVYRVELSVEVRGDILIATEKAEHLREAFDKCLPKLERQIKKYETKKIDVHRRTGAALKK